MSESDHGVVKMLSVCNCHISKETADWLNALGEVNATSHRTHELAEAHVASHGYGWVLYCTEEDLADFPEELAKIMQWARQEHGCDYINLDSDGMEHDALERYEW